MSLSTDRPWLVAPNLALGLGYLRRVPLRLRERPFWITQAFIFSITIAHYALERWVLVGQTTTVHHIPVTFYLIAVVYAGLHYGFEGGLLTAVEATLLSLPSVVIYHRSDYMYLGESAALIAAMGSGAVVAWLVEREGRLRTVAEENSQRLSLLHNLSAVINRSLDLDRVLNDAVQAVATALGTERAWVSVWGSAREHPALRAHFGDPITLQRCDSRPGLAWEAASLQVQETNEPAQLGHCALAVPLSVESQIMGALGVACREKHRFSQGDLELLTAMANQVAMAMRNAHLYREEQQMRQAVRGYARRVTRAQEDERKRIARELHDEVLQALIGVCHELDALIDTASLTPSGEERLRELRQTAQESANSVRRFSRDLRPSMLDDLGLAPSIDWLVEEMAKHCSIGTSMRLDGEPRRLEPEVELHLFRIAQEAMRNVERHACASRISVTLAFEPRQVVLEVLDDGQGLPPKVTGANALGILGMKERASLLRGELEVESVPAGGVRVRASVPA